MYINAAIFVLVDADGSLGRFLCPDIPHVEDSHQTRGEHVVRRVSMRS